MSRLVSASPPYTNFSSFIQSKTQSNFFNNPLGSLSVSVYPPTLPCSSDLKLKAVGIGVARTPQRIIIRCNSSTRPGPPSGSADGDSRTVLDAFFLGKALAEALNERIESAVGEFFSTVGRLQAEQQKQVQEFQEDVLERAKKAKEKAAREALEAQGLVPKSTTVNTTSFTVNATSTTPPLTTSTVTPSSSPTLSDPTISTDASVSSPSLSDPTNPDAETDTDPANEGSV